jgi:hypothetical protein
VARTRKRSLHTCLRFARVYRPTEYQNYIIFRAVGHIARVEAFYAFQVSGSS